MKKKIKQKNINAVPPLEMNLIMTIGHLKELYNQLVTYPDSQDLVQLLITNLESI